MTTLNRLKENQKCVIKRINVIGELEYRLFDMGLVPDTVIKMIKKAPLGDPILIELRAYTLSIRKNIAEKIYVEVIL